MHADLISPIVPALIENNDDDLECEENNQSEASSHVVTLECVNLMTT